jgi:hypothetical protein
LGVLALLSILLIILLPLIFFDVFQFTLKIRLHHAILLSPLHFASPVILTTNFRRFLRMGFFKREGGAVVAESGLEVDEQGPGERLLRLVGLVVEDWVDR